MGFFPLSISPSLIKKPLRIPSPIVHKSCSQLLAADIPNKPQPNLAALKYLSVSVRNESRYRRFWVQWEKRSIAGIKSTCSTPWDNSGAVKITGQVYCFNISVPSCYKARKCSGCKLHCHCEKRKKKQQKTNSIPIQKKPSVCSAKLEEELRRKRHDVTV